MLQCRVSIRNQRDRTVRVSDADVRREGSLAQAALVAADALGDTELVGVLHKGRWIDRP